MRLKTLFQPATLRNLSAVTALALAAVLQLSAAEPPRIVEKDGRYALLVDGRPFLVLGGQIHNSSAWPSELPQVWKSMAALHANTMEAPVYWEQIEPQEGKFDFTNVDALVDGARAHDLHLILLWFGTWKNGNMHYVPTWVKTDTTRFPRIIRADGQPIDVLSPLSSNTRDADKTAFTALMHHLKEIDSEQHTVLMIQVENESGNIGSVRDFSPEANRLIAGPVPADLLAAAGKRPGTWDQVFGSEADEIFQAYYQAKYINAIAAAGKREFDIPYYINVWIDYPAAELPQRQIDQPGIAYPSGGAVQKLVGLWTTRSSIAKPWTRTTGPIIPSGFPRLAAPTPLPSSFSTPSVTAPSASRHSGSTRPDGTSSATTRGLPTPETSHSSHPWTGQSRSLSSMARSKPGWKNPAKRPKISISASGRRPWPTVFRSRTEGPRRAQKMRTESH